MTRLRLLQCGQRFILQSQRCVQIVSGGPDAGSGRAECTCWVGRAIDPVIRLSRSGGLLAAGSD